MTSAAWVCAAVIPATPGTAHALQSQNASSPTPTPAPAQTNTSDTKQTVTGKASPADQNKPIVSNQEFESALPPLSDDINAPLEAMPTPTPTPSSTPAETTSLAQPSTTTGSSTQSQQSSPDGPITVAQPLPDEGELEKPLEPIATFDTQPPPTIEGVKQGKNTVIPYDTVIHGLDQVGLEGQFKDLSALEDGKGKAANATMISARAQSDKDLAVRLMQSVGYYDGTAITTIEPASDKNDNRVQVILTATPGKLYHLGTIKVSGDPTVPVGLVRKALPLKTGDPIDAIRVQAAEANVSLTLPEEGYPFFKLGERDILLDDSDYTGDYTLPYTLGVRASFGGFETTGKEAFSAKHIAVLARFKKGELYDSRKVDDLRKALVATGLFSTVSVEPKKTGEKGSDDTEYVNLMVRQRAGPPRTLAGELGYSTGEGIKLQGSWTNRNLFPPEGALILAGTAGSQEQGLSGTFRRSNAGKRDRTVSLTLSADHSNYDAYEAFTGTLAGRVSYDSTPIWQKRFTYAYGFELTATNEDTYNYSAGERQRKTYFIAALPLFAGWDTSDSLLNPTRGFRVKANVSPESAVKGGFRPYVRTMLETDGYLHVSDSLVLAGRVRVGSILGISRDDLPPSRRYYSGGGGSVRGYGYQQLGPIAPDGKPAGGRSLNEFSIEARYRFGNFGIVPFVDAGQSYESVYPKLSGLQFGAGIGGRYYTNFGPLRIDVATPLNPRPGDPKVALYISIGQAF